MIVFHNKTNYNMEELIFSGFSHETIFLKMYNFTSKHVQYKPNKVKQELDLIDFYINNTKYDDDLVLTKKMINKITYEMLQFYGFYENEDDDNFNPHEDESLFCKQCYNISDISDLDD